MRAPPPTHARARAHPDFFPCPPQGIFPNVSHASICLLNASRHSVNIYTFLGEGADKPPRLKVSVVPGTLIYHVLHNCCPIFIKDMNTYSGPYSDVQFMRFVLGLRSLACLPLVVDGLRILGVLRLGFEGEKQWGEQEKVGEGGGHLPGGPAWLVVTA